MEKSQSLKRKIKGAMIYPIVVVIIAALILTFIMVFIIPKFQAIFARQCGSTVERMREPREKIMKVKAGR